MLTAPGDSTCGDPDMAADTINRYYQNVFVHGDDTFVPFGQTFPQAEMIDPEKIIHTGYLVHPMPPRIDALENERPVLVSTGGGATLQGIQLYKTAIMAKAHLPEGHELHNHPWVLMVSPAYPDIVQAELRELAEAMGVDVTIRTNLPAHQFRCAISNSKLCVSLSGYNTVIETYAADVPAVLFPFQNAAQGQLFRANAFAALGKMVVFPQEAGTDASRLIGLMDEALAKQDMTQAPLKLRGEEVVADTIQRDLEKAYGSARSAYRPEHDLLGLISTHYNWAI
jgi:predicted glycosyltransferase